MNNNKMRELLFPPTGSDTRHPKVIRGIKDMIRNAKFFSYGLLKCDIRPAPVKTMCTDGYHIFYDPEFCDANPQDVVTFALLHEVVHCMFGHVGRATLPTQKLEATAAETNIALDYVTNLICEEVSLSKTSAGDIWCRVPSVREGDSCSAYLDHKYSGWSFERVLQDIVKSRKESNPQPNPDSSSGNSSDVTDAVSEVMKAAGIGQDPKDVGGIISPDVSGLTKEQRKESSDSAWARTVLEAARVCSKEVGNLPGVLKDLINNVGKTSIPWEVKLRNYLEDACSPAFHPLTFDQQYAARGLYVMGMSQEGVENLVMVWDSSGSIRSKDAATFRAEAISLVATGMVENLYLLIIDAEIQAVHHITSEADASAVPREFPGGGGTSFHTAFEWVSDNLRNDVAALVYLTDGYADFPDRPPYPTMWVATPGSLPDSGFPFGEVIRLDDNA